MPAAPTKTPAESAPQPTTEAPLSQEPDIEPPPATIALPISLDAVQKVQTRIRRVLGIDLPLSTFIARATDIANHDLPASSSSKAALTPDELFNQILGLDKISSSSNTPKLTTGNYIPQVSALSDRPPLETPPMKSKKATSEDDIYDILTGSSSSSTNIPTSFTQQSISSLQLESSSPPAPAATASSNRNLISVSLDRGTPDEKKRARTFLGRVKTILELEPGRLIL